MDALAIKCFCHFTSFGGYERTELSMSSDPDYAEIVRQAEAAVASIKDTDLKGIAFGKVLDTLLGKPGHVKDHSTAKSKPEAKRSHSRASHQAKRKGGPKGYIEELIEDDFFKTPKTLSAIRAELGNRGHHIPLTSISRPMMILCQERQLRRQKARDGKKQVFTYSDW